MSKLFYFLEPTGYNRYIAAAAEGSNNASVFKGYIGVWEDRLLKWHNAWPLNKRFELPFKSYWFKRYSKEIPNDVQYLLMAESFHLSYSRKFLYLLRNRFPQAKICYVFSNPATTYNLNKISYCGNLYDAVITFSKDDASKYKIYYCDVLPIRLPHPHKRFKNIESDVFFVGKNKGRLDKIYEIYDKLHSLGLKCKFYIVGVSDKEQRSTEEIIYNNPISYDEVLLHVQQSRCVLELLQEGCNYVSVKTAEALHYHKKLLTTNEYVEKSSIYDSRIIRVVRNIEDIDKSFVLTEVSDDIYDNVGLTETYDPLIEYLDKLFDNNE